MATRSRTLPRNAKTTPQNLFPFEFFDLLGLDMYTPDEMADPRRCVYGRNFRLYAPADTSKRVAVSKRNGHSFYSVPIGEANVGQQTTTTGGADQTLTTVAWVAQPFTVSTAGSLTKVDIRLKNTNSGTAPLIVAIYSDSSGPSTLLATSSIPESSFTSSYAYISARFIEAPTVALSTTYWIVCYQQSEATGNYLWSSTTAATTAKTSADAGNTWTSASFDMNYKVYTSTAGGVKGTHRFYRSTASPVQLFAHISDVYTINDGTGATTSIKSGLSSSATNYDWVSVNDKTYFVNGVDAPQVYDGSTVAAVAGSPPTSSQVEIHANHLFLMQPNTNYVVYSDAGVYETFGVTSFIYIPSPKTADPVIKMVSVQGVMIFFTRNTKYLLFGTDQNSFVLKESPSSKGTTGPDAVCKNEEATYFVSDDFHVYKFDGGVDTRLSSERVAAILRNVADLSEVKLYVDDKKLYVSYPSTGQTANNNRLVWDLVYNEWLSDEETYTSYGESWNSQTDTGQFVLGSSLVGAMYYGDSGTSDLGKPIKFDWWSKYMSFGAPAAKHRIKRYYAFLQSETSPHTIDCQVDVNNDNSPAPHIINLSAGGSYWGVGVWGTFVWGTTNFIRSRISVPGSAYKHQFRFVQEGADNKVDLIGFSLYVQPRRPT